MKYYDVKRHWTKKFEPHLSDRQLSQILVRDFNKYMKGRGWSYRFSTGEYPSDYETYGGIFERRGRRPRYLNYVKHGACHYLVNFNLKLITLAEPEIPWRIVTSEKHSTIWNGDTVIFDLNFLALNIPAEECFRLAHQEELPVGKSLKV